jgi:hypothetical protein
MHRIRMAIAVFLAMIASSAAAEVASTYTKLGFELNCKWDSLDHLTPAERDELLGNSAVCTGLPGYPVHYSEYDLRQFTAFGEVSADARTPASFAQFNRTGDTVEWRTENGRPYATILRWFIENMNPETGMPDEANTGQVLVISTVAQPGNPRSCPVGYVDARENSDANAIARQVADEIASKFRCGVDSPVFHGKKGPLSGDPYKTSD